MQDHSVMDPFFEVLAVDDDPGLVGIYREILETSAVRSSETVRRPSFRVTGCSQALEAIEALKRMAGQGSAFSVIFMDVNLPPGPTGIWAAEEIHKLDPSANIVLVTGYIGSEVEKLSRDLAVSDRLLFLQKPFHPQEIIQYASALSSKWLAEQRVRALNTNLESLVFRRTQELERSNEMLRQEIDRRQGAQRELQASLEAFQKIIDGAVMAIAMTLEKRDPYTAGHQQRVAHLALAIGREMGLAPDRLVGLHIASLIHDIGKISLPAEILSKPSQLTRLELGLIQGHAQAGHDILQNIEFPWPVSQIVLQHHERMDGSGYPRGLIEADILLEARIVGVADVVETMSSHRPYRPSMGLDKALDEIGTHKGRLYDTDAADACLKLIREKSFEFPPPVFP
jgi:HD-GYP domain-containing protein (c-di-GMP phosphodiesterase class II)